MSSALQGREIVGIASVRLPRALTCLLSMSVVCIISEKDSAIYYPKVT